MPGPLHYMQVMTREYLSSGTIRSMSLAAEGLYNRLRYQQWEDGELPNDPATLCRMIGADRKEFNRSWSQVRALMKETSGGNLIFEDVERQRAEAVAKVQKLRANGNKGGRPRGPVTEPSENQKVLITEPNTESESDTEDNTPLEGSTTGDRPQGERIVIDPEKFDAFFKRFQDVYPQRKGNYGWPKAKALIFEALADRDATAGEIMDGTKRFRAFMDSDKNKGTEFVPMASTWVEDHGWADEYPTVLSVVSGGKPATEQEIEELMIKAGIR